MVILPGCLFIFYSSKGYTILTHYEKIIIEENTSHLTWLETEMLAKLKLVTCR